MVAGGGFEPPYPDYESGALPLGYPATIARPRVKRRTLGLCAQYDIVSPSCAKRRRRVSNSARRLCRPAGSRNHDAILPAHYQIHSCLSFGTNTFTTASVPQLVHLILTAVT